MVEGGAQPSLDYYDLMYFVLAYARKHTTPRTGAIITEYVSICCDGPYIRNVPESMYLALAEELVRRY